ncbi:MAG: coenzyme F420-0:L-glutamate ligase [Actinobacteria bacterium]|nr:coenzyme F420-0:L-glutamate ligase [Actinomycetota bacterium]
MSLEYRVFGLRGVPEIEPGDDLSVRLAEAAERAGGLEDGDVVVVAQKVVSKAEGRIVRLDDVVASPRAIELAADRDARHVQVILDETARIVRSRPPLLISETRHGFVCASAGVDASNAKGAGTLILLPLDPDASAAALRMSLREHTGAEVGVIVSDSFGRAWRQGTTEVALGVAGVTAVLDLAGRRDAAGYELQGTQIAIADELAGAAELVLGKLRRIPAAVIRGLDTTGEGRGRDLVMPAERDLFR